MPDNICDLIHRIASENPTCGQSRIADELGLKLGIQISPRTVAKYLIASRPPGRDHGQGWATFIRNHANAIVACDFFQSVTLDFKVLYVLVAMEIGSRRILHTAVTSHPTAEWTIQQFRETLPFDHGFKFVLHDRDAIFSAQVDAMLKSSGLRVLKSPVRSPKANAFCERLIRTIRRECLDSLIPLGERHLRLILREWTAQLQQRPSAFIIRARHPGAASSDSSSRPPPPQATGPVPRHSKTSPRWLAP